MKQIIIIVLIVFFAVDTAADCRGCCSRHNGVVCTGGITQCKDGTSLSEKCQAKACNKCGVPKKPTPSVSKSPPLKLKSYRREDWPHWIDENGDCQNTRAEILIRDNVGQLKFKRNKQCNVSWGKWVCPYTGKVLIKASDVDIDHVVSLAYAHRHGGADWPRAKKRQFANDPENLLAVADAVNQEKGDKGPSEWMPPQKEYWTEYLRRWRTILTKYGLTNDTE